MIIKHLRNGVILLITFCLFGCSSRNSTETSIIPVHSHNDYSHTNPLFDALKYGCKSIEADVFPIGDSLFVAHDRNQIKSGNTLRRLYLDPIYQKVIENKGSVYGNEEELFLFVDIKINGLSTYKLLEDILKEYKQILSVYNDGIDRRGAVRIIVSGERPFEYMVGQSNRLAYFDGRLTDLNKGISNKLMPIISDDWGDYFNWDGNGEIPVLEKNKLQDITSAVKKKGFLIRFWGTPNTTEKQRRAISTELLNAQVDLIGTDDLNEIKYMFN
ncbi:phosphatidylinositol-specific phospholipase C/glycerophosphodiester phosphodiesterase family protein [Labilibaculum antarcticum]|uniref:Altered inheritance of mitochondria protein 6 n=1 Tax=Labilibaculum antarcticum TaxID=1717717 RepID=A0A1Y1CIT1_9BACT|nr:phosphatidylinositol-specific phospholipase C/glycerophosphodiester phosphodiesterase family protein [Labilibaculum antarcticum]BAX79983.1 hypothetical protein ALGA_1607 [Labilibaculum antarcticum]